MLKPQSYSEAVDEWLILSNRNFKLDRGDVLLFPSVGLRHMMTGVPDPWLSTLGAGLKAEEEMDGWLVDSRSSRASVSPVVLLKLLVLDEEREMLCRALLQSFSFNDGLSLLGHISGELGLDGVSDLISCDNGQISRGLCSMREFLSEEGISVLECKRGNRPERRFTGLLRGDLADNPGGVKVLLVHSLVLWGRPPPLRLAGTPPPTPGLLWRWDPTIVSIEWLLTRIALLKDSSSPPWPPFSSLSSSPPCPSPRIAWL